MTPPVLVIGRGPAGMLAASLFCLAGVAVDLVADGAGTLPLWSGAWHFRSYDGARLLDDPWQWWADAEGHPYAAWSSQQWREGWQTLSQVWRLAGIPTHPLPSRNWWTVSAAGTPDRAFLVPAWQYAVPAAEPVCLVGFEGLADSLADVQAVRYSRRCNLRAEVLALPSPPGWDGTWSTVRWASYLESEPGGAWLLEELTRRLAGVSDELPLLFPQVMGIRRVADILGAITRSTGRRAYEVPALPPALGGIRIQEQWTRWLLRNGARFRSGHVDGITEDGVTWHQTQSLNGAAVVNATGGVLGGGLAIRRDGSLWETVAARRLGGSSALGQDGRVVTAGRQLPGCDPDRHGDGGAVNLASAVEAVRGTLQRLGWQPARSAGEGGVGIVESH